MCYGLKCKIPHCLIDGTALVPVLTLLFGVDIRYAIGASLISVIPSDDVVGFAPFVVEQTAYRPTQRVLDADSKLGQPLLTNQ
ncbi:MAG: hypothetical protein SFW36_08180 [Leptolyngbyaceae cyanobacterium bins.59]|nr:hypothetical protein [Leptolyngbyaceae cyanobacterium bins.59]